MPPPLVIEPPHIRQERSDRQGEGGCPIQLELRVQPDAYGRRIFGAIPVKDLGGENGCYETPWEKHHGSNGHGFHRQGITLAGDGGSLGGLSEGDAYQRVGLRYDMG